MLLPGWQFSREEVKCRKKVSIGIISAIFSEKSFSVKGLLWNLHQLLTQQSERKVSGARSAVVASASCVMDLRR